MTIITIMMLRDREREREKPLSACPDSQIGIFNSYKSFMMMTWEMPVAGIILAFCGYSFGAVFAMLWCLSKDKVIAISIETALQNAGVAFILLKLSLPSPDR